MSDLRARRATVTLVSALLLLLALVMSLSFGSNAISWPQVWSALFNPDSSAETGVIRELRLPRTVVAAIVGAALAVAGGIMQSLTRNPLADPGILGINAGASLLVVTSVALGGLAGVTTYVWFALLGAGLAAAGVFVLAGTGRNGGTPVRLALAGVSISAALAAITQIVILSDQEAFNEFRFWVAGSLEGRGWQVLAATWPFLLAGVVLALLLGPALNVLALGDDTGHALGLSVGRTRVLAMVTVALLCGGATAAVGPIAFVGLAVPIAARALVGTDQRWVTVLCLLLGPVWLLLADTLARVVLAPQEVPAGIITALLGAPVFVAIVRQGKVVAV